jgi:hypothetical protein
MNVTLTAATFDDRTFECLCRCEVTFDIDAEGAKDLTIPCLGWATVQDLINDKKNDYQRMGILPSPVDMLAQTLSKHAGKELSPETVLAAMQAGQYSHSPALLPEKYSGRPSFSASPTATPEPATERPAS